MHIKKQIYKCENPPKVSAIQSSMDSFIIQRPKSPEQKSILPETSQVSELSDDSGLKIEILEPRPQFSFENSPL